MNKLITALFSTLLAIYPLAAVAADTTAKSAPLSFELKDQNGKIHKSSDLNGKIVVMHWTNAGCPFVKRHFTEQTFNNLAKEFSGKGVEFIAVDSSNFVTETALKETTSENHLTYPTLLDPSGSVGKIFGAKTTPHVFILDKNGTIVYQGAVDDDSAGDKDVTQRTNYVRAALNDLLAGKAIANASTKPYGCSVKYAS